MKNGMLSAKLFDSRILSQNVTGKEMYLLIRNEQALLIYSGYGKIDLRQLRTIKRKQIAKRWQMGWILPVPVCTGRTKSDCRAKAVSQNR